MRKEDAALIARLVKTAAELQKRRVGPATPNLIAQLQKAAMDADLQARMEKTAVPWELAGRALGAGWRGLTGLGSKLFTAPAGTAATRATNKATAAEAARRAAEAKAAARAAAAPPAAPAAAAPAAAPATPPMPREFSGRRAAVTLGLPAVAAGGFGINEMHDRAQDQVGVSSNPFTWGRGHIGQRMGFSGGPSHEDVYSRNANKLKELQLNLQREIDTAAKTGNTEYVNQLKAQMARGKETGEYGDPTATFDPLNGQWSINPFRRKMWGLNPFAPDSGKSYHDKMLASQNALQSEYDTHMKEVGTQPGDVEKLKGMQDSLNAGNMLPARRREIEEQMKALRERMSMRPGVENDAAKAVAARMATAGMYRKPFASTAAPAVPTGAGDWANIGRRPPRPTGFGYNPWAFGNGGGAWEQTMQSGNSPFVG